MKKLTAFLFPFFFFYAAGQSPEPISRNSSDAYDSAVSLYFSNQDRTLAIHNGRVFYGYPGTLEHAFYLENSWQNGSVLYDGTWYHDTPLMYDIYKDEVIILHPNNMSVRLYSERVQKFNFNGLAFVRLLPDKDNVLKSGFYQQLTDGNVTIFVRRHKKLEEKIEGFIIERKFISSDHFYVLKGGNYYPIGKQKSLLNLLKDSRQSIQRHLKQQKLKYRKEREKTIVQIAEFYNQSHK